MKKQISDFLKTDKKRWEQAQAWELAHWKRNDDYTPVNNPPLKREACKIRKDKLHVD